jgi:hypothetical protein
MTTPDEVRFSRAGGKYVNSPPFTRRPFEEQQVIRSALQDARTWADLPDAIRGEMEAAGFGPGWQQT